MGDLGPLIEEVLEGAGRPATSSLNGLLRNRDSVVQAVESTRIEYKRDFGDTGRDWMELLKDVVAFHNSGGGLIVFGISDEGALAGLTSSLMHHLDPANIGNKLRRKAPSARIETRYFEWSYFSKRYGVLGVTPGDRIVVFDKDGDYQKLGGRSEKAFAAGVVYARSPGMCAPASQADVDLMVERAVQAELSRRIARIDFVARIPGENPLIAVDPSNPGAGFRLVNSTQGVPVTIVEEADEAMPLREVLDPSAPYGGVASEVAAAVRLWHSHPDDRASSATLYEWYLRRDEADMSFAAEYCLLSAVSSHAFPMYWASLLEEAELLEILNREIVRGLHPFPDVYPHLVATFFWDRRRDLFGQNKAYLSTRALGVAQRVERLTRAEYLLHGRCRSQRVRDPRHTGRRIKLEHLATSRQEAQDILEEIMVLELEGRRDPSRKSLGHQLDIILAAPDGAPPH